MQQKQREAISLSHCDKDAKAKSNDALPLQTGAVLKAHLNTFVVPALEGQAGGRYRSVPGSRVDFSRKIRKKLSGSKGVVARLLHVIGFCNEGNRIKQTVFVHITLAKSYNYRSI